MIKPILSFSALPPVCVLLCPEQYSALPAAQEGIWRSRLHVTVHVPRAALCPAGPPGLPCPQNDPAADLPPAEDDEAGQEERGCHS